MAHTLVYKITYVTISFSNATDGDEELHVGNGKLLPLDRMSQHGKFIPLFGIFFVIKKTNRVEIFSDTLLPKMKRQMRASSKPFVKQTQKVIQTEQCSSFFFN